MLGISLRHKDAKRGAVHSIYIAAFLFAAHLGLTSYANSSFLSTFFPESVVGFLYTFGSLLTILFLPFLPRTLSRIGNYKTAVAASLLEAAALLGLAFFKEPILLAVVFAARLVLIMAIYISMDIFLENNSDDGETGGVRGMFLTATNIAWVLAPTAMGFLLADGNFQNIYLASAALTVLIAILFATHFRSFRDPRYERAPFWETFREVRARKNVFHVFMANLILRFFYSWMVIYTPIYLADHLGMPWSDIGIVFTIMLLPFVLLEIPLGKLADTKLGEKELLAAGFVIAGVATASLSFIESDRLIVWAGALFATRVGASMVEIMSETYFFKKIDGSDAHILGFFRNTRPLAYIVSPFVASAVLFFLPFQFLFLVLGGVVLAGVVHALLLEDTL